MTHFVHPVENIITDVKVPFWSVLVLTFKVVIASILVSLLLTGVASLIVAIFGIGAILVGA